MRYPAALMSIATVCLCLALPGPTAATRSRGEVILPSGRVLLVELAVTPAERALGYMFREKITENEGMLFLMEQIGFHPFWMKNCKVGLDILWIDETWKVVHIERQVPPCAQEPCPSYIPMQAALYVLEMQSGLSAKSGVRLGDRILYRPPS